MPQRHAGPFRDRDDAGEQLAQALSFLRGQHPLVLAIPRGGVPVGRIVADRLDGELDVVLVRKGQPLYPVRKKKEAPRPAEVAVAGDAAASPPAEPRRHYTVLVNAPRNIWVRGSDVNAEIGLSDGFRIEYGDEALLFG